jgi:hypothetical protein
MALRVTADFPGGNVCGPQVEMAGDLPEITFAAHPKGGTRALWFHWKAKETRKENVPEGKLRITLRGVDEWLEPAVAAELLPVYHPSGQGWHRCSSGTVSIEPDGRCSMSWLIPYPAPETEVALCFPYGPQEFESLRSKSRQYWSEDTIGVTEEGGALMRWSNAYGALNHRKSGLYLVARECAGETPGAWVLDGLLQHMARIKRDPFMVWTVPVADPDGVERGMHGPARYPLDVDRAWGDMPRRREALLIQRDIDRWQTRCQPGLVIDFHAADPGDKTGVSCLLPDAQQYPRQHQAAEKWANVIRQGLQPEWAATEFKQMWHPAPSPDCCTLPEHLCRNTEICVLSFYIPYFRINSKILSQKNYREIGEAIAKALINKASARA